MLSTPPSYETASTLNEHSVSKRSSSETGARFSYPLCLTNLLTYAITATRLEINSM